MNLEVPEATMVARWKSVSVATLLLGVAACSGPAPAGSPKPAGANQANEGNGGTNQTDRVVPLGGAALPANVARVRLVSYDKCADLLSYFKTEGVRRVQPWGLDGPHLLYRTGGMPAADTAQAGAEKAAPQQGTDYSGTNVQEAGVDEPDQVKTDGRYLYVARENRVDIVDVTSGKPKRVDSVKVGGPQTWGAELLLDGDRLLVMTQAYEGFKKDEAVDIVPQPQLSRSLLQLFDVSDRANVKPVASLRLDGSVVTARLVEGTARIVQRSEPARLPWRQPIPQPGKDGRALPSGPKEQARLDKQSLAANQKLVRNSKLDDWLPQFSHTTADGRERHGQLLDCDQIHRPREFSGFGQTSVLSVDLGGDLSPAGSTAVMAGAGTVYASATRLYVSTAKWYDLQRIPAVQKRRQSEQYRTSLHAFDISNAARVAYIGSGEVRGHLMSQWAMSEHKGVLRVATTDGMPWGGSDRSESFVTTFSERGPALVKLGQVGGLGKGERIYSVRFIGDIGYVVTFRQVDPLYTVDLANPAAPKVKGELKIPGYSAYLHPVGDGLIIGVGQNADKDGRVTGLQLSLFDVSDLNAPRRLHTKTLGQAWTNVENSHHGFLYWPKTKLVVVPYVGYQPDGREGTSGAIGLTVDRTRGFEEVGKVSHLDSAPRKSVKAPEVAWTSQVDRSIVIGDTLFTISQAGVEAARLDTLQQSAWLALPTRTN